MITAHQKEDLWQEYRSQLFRFVLRRVEDQDTAEDIVHDVLVRAYQKRDTLRNGQKFEQWLYQITRNAVIDHYRARRPSASLPMDLAHPDEPTSGGARRELAECMQPLVEALPAHYQKAVLLSEFEGLTQQETADRLGLSLSGAKSRVQRARKLLEGKLLACCRIEFDARGAIVDYESKGGCDAGGNSAMSGCGKCDT